MNRYMYLVLVFSIGAFLSIAKLAHGETKITLTRSNTVVLNMPIDAQTAANVQQQLMTKDQRVGNEPLYLVLNSPGGSVVDGQRIIETAKGLRSPVHTITVFSASMSFIISQYLGKRYILESGTMMSHHASAGGLSGQVPGNLITRAMALLNSIQAIETKVAARAHLSLKQYQAMIDNEMWLEGQAAVKEGFADSIATVTCDPSLNKPGESQTMQVFGIPVKVTWHACPLIAEPLAVEFGGNIAPDMKTRVMEALYNKAVWARGVGFTSPTN